MQKFLSAMFCGTCLFFSSCFNNKKENDFIKKIEKALMNSNYLINASTQIALKQIQDKTKEPSSIDIAKKMYPKAEQVIKLSNDLYELFQTKKNRLPKEIINSEYVGEQLSKYKKNILGIDTFLQAEFKNNFPVIKKDSSFSITSEALTLFQNNIRTLENQLIHFYLSKSSLGCNLFFYDSYSLLLVQNSNYLKPGDMLEIKAGVGSFSKSAQPKITFNGIEIELGEEGYSLYKLKTQKVPGTYKIPVVYNYFNQTTGKDETRQVEVEYTVVKPCNDN